MSEVNYNDLPDTQKQQIRDEVPTIKEMMTPTADSFASSTKKVTGGQQGYQLVFFTNDYGQNSYLSPGATGNSFVQPVAPKSKSMWVGLAFPGKAMYTDGIFMETMDTKASLINNAKLRRLAIENFFKTMNYYAIGDNFGYGILAVVSSVTGGVFTGTTAAQTTAGYTKGAHRLLSGVTYDVVDESTLQVVGTITPTQDGIFSATVPVTATGSPNNAGAFVVEQGAFFKVPRGLAYLINPNDREFQGLDTTEFAEFNSTQTDLNGSAVTSATVNTQKTKVQIRLNAATGEFSRIGHLPQGQYNTLAIQGFGARQYQAAEGQATTSYGYPNRYKDGDVMWVVDADMDEDRIYLRRSSDFFKFSLTPFGTVNRDGLTLRQAPGDNNVGADAWFEQVREYYNFGFDGDGNPGVGNGASSVIIRAQIQNSQVNVLS